VKYEASVGSRVLRIEVRAAGAGYTVTVDGRPLQVDVSETSQGFTSLVVDGTAHEVGVTAREIGYSVLAAGRLIEVGLREAGAAGLAPRASAQGGPARVTAPMPGRLVKVLVEPGQEVAEGQGLVVMEAMKMENELRAPRAGRVKELPARDRQAVESGALLVVLE
jgi:biotin carboxyl carrier protein